VRTSTKWLLWICVVVFALILIHPDLDLAEANCIQIDRGHLNSRVTLHNWHTEVAKSWGTSQLIRGIFWGKAAPNHLGSLLHPRGTAVASTILKI
jgi:hypothetical protein